MPIYMKYEGIEGPVTGKYKGWIELESAQIGIHRNINRPVGSGANREANSPSISEISITKRQDNASTKLFKESLTGKAVKVTIDFVDKDGTAPYLSLELEGTMISGFSISGHGGDSSDRPMESLTLNFTKVTFTTKPTAPAKGNEGVAQKTSWDAVVK